MAAAMAACGGSVRGAVTVHSLPIMPADFDTSVYLHESGTEAGSPGTFEISGTTYVKNMTLTASMANGGTVVERYPISAQTDAETIATYKRPVFSNMNFDNVRIPKGLNALFLNCTFNGVTYVDLTTTIQNVLGGTTTDPTDGRLWAQRMNTGTWSPTTILTATNSKGFTTGNNLRFNGCVIDGILAAANPTANTSFANAWQFTGLGYFDNTFDHTTNLVAPQTIVRLANTLNASAGSSMAGAVVASNMKFNGVTNLHGSFIVPSTGTFELFAGAQVNLGLDPNLYPGVSSSHPASIVTSLSIDPTAKLNLRREKLIVQSKGGFDKTGTIGMLENAITSGLITSSNDWYYQLPFYTTGLYDNATLGLTTFGGEPVNKDSLLLTYALLGDANLDNRIDDSDFKIVDAHFGQAGGTWAEGDFNLDGWVDDRDVTLLANSWLPWLRFRMGPAVALGGPGGAGGASSVPEAGSLGVLVVGVVALMMRR